MITSGNRTNVNVTDVSPVDIIPPSHLKGSIWDHIFHGVYEFLRHWRSLVNSDTIRYNNCRSLTSIVYSINFVVDLCPWNKEFSRYMFLFLKFWVFVYCFWFPPFYFSIKANLYSIKIIINKNWQNQNWARSQVISILASTGHEDLTPELQKSLNDFWNKSQNKKGIHKIIYYQYYYFELPHNFFERV